MKARLARIALPAALCGGGVGTTFWLGWHGDVIYIVGIFLGSIPIPNRTRSTR